VTVQKDDRLKAEQTLGQKLDDVIAKLPSGNVTLGSILTIVEREGLLLFCVLLTLPFMVPVSIPGVSTVFGLVILLIGLSVLFDYTPRLPKRLTERPFPSDKLRHALQRGSIWVHRLERVSRPRLLVLTHGTAFQRFNGLMLVMAALLLMAPFGLVPFSNTLPGLAVLFLVVGILQRDGGCVLLGYLTNVLTLAYFAFLVLGGGVLFYELWKKAVGWFS
jgi:hypothetical protein